MHIHFLCTYLFNLQVNHIFCSKLEVILYNAFGSIKTKAIFKQVERIEQRWKLQYGSHFQLPSLLPKDRSKSRSALSVEKEIFKNERIELCTTHIFDVCRP